MGIEFTHEKLHFVRLILLELCMFSDGHEPIFLGSGRVEPDTIWLEPGRAGP